MFTRIRNTIEDILDEQQKNDGSGIEKIRIAIIPFGQNGLLCKQILNQLFGIDEEFKVDNNLSRYNSSIISVNDFLNEELEDVHVILSSLNSEIVSQLNSFADKGFHLHSIFLDTTPIVRHSSNKGAFFRDIKSLLKIRKVDAYDVVRVGKNNDGGYLMLDDFSDDMRAYSFGICDDMSWDKWISQRSGMTVFMYDHTIQHAPENCALCPFKKIGIGVTDDSTHSLYSLKTILKQNEDLENNNLILKMDIEGAEWDIIDSWEVEDLSHFRQISLEFHGLTNISNSQQIIRCLKKISCSHNPIWIHGNNYVPAEECDGMVIPISLEVTYARINSYTFSKERVYLPFAADMPNKPETEDFDIGDWS